MSYSDYEARFPDENLYRVLADALRDAFRILKARQDRVSGNADSRRAYRDALELVEVVRRGLDELADAKGRAIRAAQKNDEAGPKEEPPIDIEALLPGIKRIRLSYDEHPDWVTDRVQEALADGYPG
jgi:hypothetical protein